MPATADPHLLGCPACRLSFPSRSALRRHDALDHRPAPDGAWLTAQLVGAPPSGGGAAPDVDDDAPLPPTPPSSPPGRRAPLGWALVLVLSLVAAAALPVPLSLAAVSALLVLVCGRWAHRHLEQRPHGSHPEDSDDPHDQHRRSPAA